RLLPLPRATLSATAAAAGSRHALLSRGPSSSLSYASCRLAPAGPLRVRLPPRAATRALSATASLAATTTITVGERLPDATLSYFDSPDGELKMVTVRDRTAGKNVVLFAVQGAFTPTCIQKHLPGFLARAGELRAKGVDAVACVSVNDAFLMRRGAAALGRQRGADARHGHGAGPVGQAGEARRPVVPLGREASNGGYCWRAPASLASQDSHLTGSRRRKKKVA
uniref:glutaredoxin-dependent peroxiredoxin n=1 Tax=Aegilops tauschii subsp. strangulata TaxID=200361 RepID=A0A453JD37_AEGTS